MAITFRPVTAHDEAFLCAVYASTRAEEMALVPWTDEQRQAFVHMQFTAQQEHYRTFFPQARHEIVLQDQHPVGRLYVDRTVDEIHILDLTILPAHRNTGIGTAILQDLLAEAAHQGQRVRMQVESFNTSLHLFARLGFSRVAEQGLHYTLVWSPDAGYIDHATRGGEA